jgi:WD40 repeat protein
MQFIVSKDSALMSLGGEIKLPMNQDHRGLAQHSDPSREDFRNLERRMSVFGHEFGPIKPTVQGTPREQDASVRRLLGIQQGHKDDLGFFQSKQWKNTAEWIIETNEFKAWVENRDGANKILWISGESGSGKSVMVPPIVEYIQKNHSNCHYYFFREPPGTGQSMISLLKALAAQMAQDFWQFRKHLASLAESEYHPDWDLEKSVWTTIFAAALPGLDYKIDDRIYWVIDGLDRCPSAEGFLESFASLVSSAIPLKLLVLSSRTVPLYFSLSRLGAVVLDIHAHEARISAYYSYLEDKLGKDHQRITKAKKFARGNFMLSCLAIEGLGPSFFDQELSLNAKSIDLHFETIWHSLMVPVMGSWVGDERDIAETMLTFIMHCQAPLTLAQLHDALRLCGFKIAEGCLIDRLCGSLVELDNGVMRLNHKNARRYLTEGSGKSLVPNFLTAHGVILKACLRSIVQVYDEPNHTRPHPTTFHEYALDYWDCHLIQSASALDTQALTLVENFLNGRVISLWISELARRHDLPRLIKATVAFDTLKRIRNLRALQAHPVDALLHLWALDLTKVFGSYRRMLTTESSVSDIAAFAPKNSMLRRYFAGRAIPLRIDVKGVSEEEWADDCARLPSDETQREVVCSNRHVAILCQPDNGLVRVFNSLNIFSTRNILHNEYVQSIRISNLGRLLATFGRDTLKVWIIDDESRHWTFRLPSSARLFDMAFSLDDQFILCMVANNSIWRYQLSLEEKPPEIISLPRSKTVMHGSVLIPSHAVFSRGAQKIVASFGTFPTRAWSLSSCLKFSDEHEDSHSAGGKWNVTVEKIGWTANADHVISVRSDGSAWIWDLENDMSTKIVDSEAENIRCSPTGSYLIIQTKDEAFNIWKLSGPEFIHKLRIGEDVRDFTISSDGYRIYGLRGCSCEIWSPYCLYLLSPSPALSYPGIDAVGWGASFSEMRRASVKPRARIEKLAIGPVTGLLCTSHTDIGVRITDVDGNALPIHSLGYLTVVDHIVWHQDETQLAVASDDGNVWILQTTEGQPSGLRTVLKKKLETGIHQIMFCGARDSLLIVREKSLHLWSYREESEITKAIEIAKPLRWINHPLRRNILLGVGLSRVVARKLPGLELLGDLILTPLDKIQTNEMLIHVAQIWDSVDRSHILIRTNTQDQREFYVHMLHISDIDNALKMNHQKITGFLLPHHLTAEITVILGFIESRMCQSGLAAPSSWAVAFLNHKGTICTFDGNLTWREHQILPDDWHDGEYLKLAQVTRQGAVLIPKNGRVGIMRKLWK